MLIPPVRVIWNSIPKSKFVDEHKVLFQHCACDGVVHKLNKTATYGMTNVTHLKVNTGAASRYSLALSK
jgi:hypothetical protein